MILRRITEHVKTQNWLAVGIDFFIVVVGVFIGLQFSNWNEARQERAQEADYVQRLHDEAKAGLDGLLGWVGVYFEPRYKEYQALVIRMGEGDLDEITISDAQCDVIGNMHDFIAMPSQFPSLAEMTASGQFDLISDPTLRRTLINYRMMKDQSQVLIDNLNTSLTILPNDFPQYFEAQLTNDTPGLELTYKNCDAVGMMADKAFMNRFADTASRYNQYYNIVIDQEKTRVATMHDLLDEKLGIVHDEDQE